MDYDVDAYITMSTYFYTWAETISWADTTLVIAH